MITPTINYTNGQVLPAGGVGSYNIPTQPSNFPNKGNPYTPTNTSQPDPSFFNYEDYSKNFTFDSGDLRSQIANGSLTPEEALRSVNGMFMSGQKTNGNNGYGAAGTSNLINKWKSQLYSQPLDINAGNRIGSLNPDGSISQKSTTFNISNTSGAGENSQKYYTQPTGGMLKATAVPKSNISVNGLPQLPKY